LTKDKIVYFQDEQLANWAKFNFGKTISHSVLGRVKSKLMMLEKETNHEDAVCISKWTATTKVCFDCGSKHEMTLDDRIFVCPVCGHRRS
jgi:transposase